MHISKPRARHRVVVSHATKYTIEELERRVLLATFAWIGGSGSWTDPKNWSQPDPNNPTIPGGKDAVIIGANGDPQITNGSACNSLDIENPCYLGPTIDLSANQIAINADVTMGSMELEAKGTFSLNGTLTIGQYGNLRLDSTASISGTGAIDLANPLSAFTGQADLTIPSSISVSGDGSVSATDILTNQTTITSQATDAGHEMQLDAGTNLVNSGIIDGSTGYIAIEGNLTTAGLGTIYGGNDTVSIVGTLNNSGATLDLNSTTGSWNLDHGGTIHGGTIETLDGQELDVHETDSAVGGTLDGVKLSGSMDISGTGEIATIKNGLTLDGTITVGAQLTCDGTESIQTDSFGTIVLTSDGNGLSASSSTNANTTLTIGSGITVRGGGAPNALISSSGNGVQAIDNQGVIVADIASRTILADPDSFTNEGTVEAMNGATLTMTTTPTNFSSGTLTGGTWEVLAGSTLRINGVDITNNSATIDLNGSTANLYDSSSGITSELTGLVTNAGSLTLEGGHNFTVAGTASFTNSGTMSIGTATTFSAGGEFASSGTLIVSGSLSLNGASTATGPVTNSGTITSNSTFELSDGGSATGIFSVPGAPVISSVRFDTAPFNLEAGSSVTGTGDAIFTDDQTDDGSINIGRLFINGAGSSITFNGSVTTAAAMELLDTASATFNGPTSPNSIVSLTSESGTFNQAVTTGAVLVESGTLLFNADLTASANLEIDSPGEVELDGGTLNAKSIFGSGDLRMVGGTDTVSAPINDIGRIYVIGDGTVASFTNTLSTTAAVVLENSSSATFSGSAVTPTNIAVIGNATGIFQTALSTGPISMTGGSLQFGANATLSGALNLAGGAAVKISAGGGSILQSSALTIDSTSKIDLADNALIIDYSGSSPIGTIQGYLQTGYANGSWNGLGINSSTAASHPNHGLGLAEASDLYSTFPAIFDGRSVDNTAILIRYTVNGDANLDASVNSSDFSLLAANYNKSTSARWSQGDFNYGGQVNALDFNTLATNYGSSSSASPMVDLAVHATSIQVASGLFSDASISTDDQIKALLN